MYAAHLLLRSRRLAPRRIRSVYPSEPAPRPIRIDLRAWLGVGHSDTHHTRSRASGTRRSDGIRLRSVSSRRIGNKPSMVHPSTHLKTTAPGGGEVTATAGRPQTHAAETTRPAGRYGIPHTAHHASPSERYLTHLTTTPRMWWVRIRAGGTEKAPGVRARSPGRADGWRFGFAAGRLYWSPLHSFAKLALVVSMRQRFRFGKI